jgi:ribose 5-phosphate isomerase B
LNIYLASDHGGFELKEKIKKYLLAKGLSVKDLGPEKLEPTDDFPDFAIPLARKVAESKGNLGIVLCRNGAGVEIAANKIDGVRAVLSWESEHAASTRADDNANVLALPADYLDEQKAFEIVDTWLSTPYSQEQRFERRLEKIEKEEESG